MVNTKCDKCNRYVKDVGRLQPVDGKKVSRGYETKKICSTCKWLMDRRKSKIRGPLSVEEVRAFLIRERKKIRQGIFHHMKNKYSTPFGDWIIRKEQYEEFRKYCFRY